MLFKEVLRLDNLLHKRVTLKWCIGQIGNTDRIGQCNKERMKCDYLSISSSDQGLYPVLVTKATFRSLH